MSINTGYRKARRTIKSDENFTPYYAVEPIVKYLPKNSILWLPFDKEWSAFNQVLKANGYKTICTHKDNGKDFFEFEPKEWDIIVSNPPFSIKDKIIKRVYKLGKPFCLLLPLATLQSKVRFEYLKSDLQILCFDKRITFHDERNLLKTVKGVPYASAYFIGGGLLPRDLILEKLNIYEKALECDEFSCQIE